MLQATSGIVSYLLTNKQTNPDLASPANDFDLYANSKWKLENQLPADKPMWGTFHVLRDQNQDRLHQILEESDTPLKPMYQAGMNMENRNDQETIPIQHHLAQVHSMTNTDDLLKLFARFNQDGISCPFSIGVDQDQKNSSMNTLMVSQSGLGLPGKEYYSNDDQETRDKYMAHLAQYLDSNTIMEVETQIADAHLDKQSMRDVEKTYNKQTLGDWQTTLTHDWLTNYFQQITDKLTPESELVMSSPEYWQKLDQLLDTISLDQWKQYLTWKVYQSTVSYLSEDLESWHFEFYGQTLSGQKEQEQLYKRVTKTVDGSAGELLGQAYVDQYFPPSSKEYLLEMIDRLKASLQVMLQDSEWMSDSTKEAAMVKLNKIRAKVGYPDEWTDFSELNFDGCESYYEYVLRCRQFDFQKDLKELYQPVNPNKWYMTPQTINAYYSPPENCIVFPAGILQPPMFDPTQSDGANFGGIGAIIGHEITHGYDTMGNKYNGDGNLENWWQELDQERFDAEVQKIINQFDQYPVLDEKANGTFLKEEDLADMGGLRMSYRALMDLLKSKYWGPKRQAFASAYNKMIPASHPRFEEFYFKHEIQDFFINWANSFKCNVSDERARQLLKIDPHAPSKWRINGPLSAMPEFHHAFGVLDGDAMFLPEDERCNVWQ